jgi:hypothetical protein
MIIDFAWLWLQKKTVSMQIFGQPCKALYLLPSNWLSDMVHQMWSAIHGRLYHCPLQDTTLKRALDIGTGRGLWATEFGMSLPT